ncbi:MAG: hypothetical protein ACF8XB_07735 [Planctomycetota bacterium JB042]
MSEIAEVPYEPESPAEKPGVQTSEFALSVGAVVAYVAAKVFGIEIDPVDVAALIGIVAPYVLGRSIAKRPQSLLS